MAKFVHLALPGPHARGAPRQARDARAAAAGPRPALPRRLRPTLRAAQPGRPPAARAAVLGEGRGARLALPGDATDRAEPAPREGRPRLPRPLGGPPPKGLRSRRARLPWLRRPHAPHRLHRRGERRQTHPRPLRARLTPSADRPRPRAPRGPRTTSRSRPARPGPSRLSVCRPRPSPAPAARAHGPPAQRADVLAGAHGW